MKKKKSILAIITARHGSKGVKNKNIKKINNKPLIHYTFDFIKKNNFFCDALFTTNSNPLIEYAEKFKFIKCPFKRPEYLSQDNSRQEDAILHALKWYEKNFSLPDFICILEPTTPFRSKNTYEKAIKFLKNKNIDGVFTVSKSRHDPTLINRLRKDYYMSNWNTVVKNRQQYSDYFFLTSSAVIVKTLYFKKHKTLLSPKSKAIVVDDLESLMIDEKIDFFLVKSLIEKNITTQKKLSKLVDNLK